MQEPTITATQATPSIPPKAGPMQTKKSKDDVCERLLRAYKPTKAGLLEKIAAEAGFGREWNDVKHAIKLAPGVTIQKWLTDNELPFSQQYANGCGRLAKVHDLSFRPAHLWYQQSGFAAGYQTKKTQGGSMRARSLLCMQSRNGAATGKTSRSLLQRNRKRFKKKS